MKFKIDENLPAEIRDDLRAMGHDAELVSDEGLTGSPDKVLLEHVRREKRAVLTLEIGFRFRREQEWLVTGASR